MQQAKRLDLKLRYAADSWEMSEHGSAMQSLLGAVFDLKLHEPFRLRPALIAAILACYHLRHARIEVLLGVLVAIATQRWTRKQSKVLPLILRLELHVHASGLADMQHDVSKLYRSVLRHATPLPTSEARHASVSTQRLLEHMHSQMDSCSVRHGNGTGMTLLETIVMLSAGHMYLNWIKQRVVEVLRRASGKSSGFRTMMQKAACSKNVFYVDLSRQLLDSITVVQDVFEVQLLAYQAVMAQPAVTHVLASSPAFFSALVSADSEHHVEAYLQDAVEDGVCPPPLSSERSQDVISMLRTLRHQRHDVISWHVLSSYVTLLLALSLSEEQVSELIFQKESTGKLPELPEAVDYIVERLCMHACTH